MYWFTIKGGLYLVMNIYYWDTLLLYYLDDWQQTAISFFPKGHGKPFKLGLRPQSFHRIWVAHLEGVHGATPSSTGQGSSSAGQHRSFFHRHFLVFNIKLSPPLPRNNSTVETDPNKAELDLLILILSSFSPFSSSSSWPLFPSSSPSCQTKGKRTVEVVRL